MIPDPHTAEGRAEIRRRMKKFEESSPGHKDRWESGVNDEPGGAWTQPSEFDLKRDEKHDD